MNVYIWEDVLTDYTSGMAVAYAETLEQALEKLAGNSGSIAEQLGAPTTIIDCDNNKEPFAAYVYGGS